MPMDAMRCVDACLFELHWGCLSCPVRGWWVPGVVCRGWRRQRQGSGGAGGPPPSPLAWFSYPTRCAREVPCGAADGVVPVKCGEEQDSRGDERRMRYASRRFGKPAQWVGEPREWLAESADVRLARDQW